MLMSKDPFPRTESSDTGTGTDTDSPEDRAEFRGHRPARVPPLRRLPIPVISETPSPVSPKTRPEPPSRLTEQTVLEFAFPTPATAQFPPLRSHVPAPQTMDTSDHRAWVAAFVRAALEVTTGQRPAHQLIRWCGPDVLKSLERRRALAAAVSRPRGAMTAPADGATGRGRIRSIRSDSPRAGVVECAVVVEDGSRVRAVAVRAEQRRGRWRVTALALG
jgi:hypothetical protein